MYNNSENPLSHRKKYRMRGKETFSFYKIIVWFGEMVAVQKWLRWSVSGEFSVPFTPFPIMLWLREQLVFPVKVYFICGQSIVTVHPGFCLN